MSLRCLTLILLAGPLSTVAGRAQVVSIAGRTECDTSKYHDPPVALTDLVDSAAIMSLLREFHLRPPDAFTIGLRIFPDSEVDVRVVANRHSAGQRDSLARAIRPYVHHPIGVNQPLILNIDVHDNPELTVSLSPAAYTCPIALRNVLDIRDAFNLGIRRLLKEGTFPPGVHGRLIVGFQVLADGTPDHIGIDSSSGYPALDSVAGAAVSLGRFRPAVVGRVAVTTFARQRFQY